MELVHQRAAKKKKKKDYTVYYGLSRSALERI